MVLRDPCTPVGAPTSKHHRAHVEGVTGPVAYLTIPATTRNSPLTMCATPTSHHPGAHPGMAGTWFPPHCRCTIVTPTSRHHGHHVAGVTHTMDHLTIHIHAPNTPTPARKQVGGVAPASGRARGGRRIHEPRWYPQRLVVQDNMCSELPRGWPTLQSTLRPPTS